MSIDRVVDDDPKLKARQRDFAKISLDLLGPVLSEKNIERLVEQSEPPERDEPPAAEAAPAG